MANAGVGLCSVHSTVDVRLTQTGRLDELHERLQADLPLAGRLQAPVLTASVGALPPADSGVERDAAFDVLARLGETAQAGGVLLALSTGAAKPEELAEALGQIGYGTLGVNLDTGRLALRGIEAATAVKALAGHIVHLHATDAVPGEDLVPLGKGDVDWNALAAALNDAAYAGPVVLRLRPGRSHKPQAADGLTFLRAAFA